MIVMNREDIGRLKAFSRDPNTVEALKKLFLNVFLKPKESDVQLLASSRLAIDLLDKAFKELDYLKYKEELKQEGGHIAL